MSSTPNTTSTASNKLFAIMGKKRRIENTLSSVIEPKPVKDYRKSVEIHLKNALKSLTGVKEIHEERMSTMDEKTKDIFQYYDCNDNTVYDAIKDLMDTLEKKCKPLEEAHAANKEAMRLEIQQLAEEEEATRREMAAEHAAAKRAKKH